MKKILKLILFLMIFVLGITLFSCNENTSNKEVKNLSGDYGFTAEGKFEKGSTLVVNPLSEVTDEQKALIATKGICVNQNMQAYDISVKRNNVKVQPNGKVKITLEFDGDSSSDYVVLHFKSNTNMEVLSADINDGKLSFETTSFSVFIIAENIPEEYNFNITYNLDGGSFANDTSVPKTYSNNSKFPLVLPTPTKSGYIFDGWKNAYDIEMLEISSNIRGDLILTAQWKKTTEEFFLFRLEMDKIDENDSNIKTIEFYSTRVSDGKSEILKPRIDGSFENDSQVGLKVAIGGGAYIDILSNEVYKKCTAGSLNQEIGNHGYCFYDGSFSGKISINDEYMIFILKKIGGEMDPEERLEEISTDDFQILSEGRYFVVRKDVYNAAVAAGKKNETGELYQALSYLSEPHDDGLGNIIIEDITACYEIWIQFDTSLKHS